MTDPNKDQLGGSLVKTRWQNRLHPPFPGPRQDELAQINAEDMSTHLSDVAGPPKLKNSY